MILSYRDKRTQDFANGKRVKTFAGFERSAQIRLDRLEAATSIKDLAALPGNFLEALRGDRRGQYSIRVGGLLADRVGGIQQLQHLFRRRLVLVRHGLKKLQFA